MISDHTATKPKHSMKEGGTPSMELLTLWAQSWGSLLQIWLTQQKATQQLVDKYSHELWVYKREHRKYDMVKQQQDYWTWHSRQSKEWLDDFEFGEAPSDVFKQYDEMRCGLADEVLFSINDTRATTQVGLIVKRIQQVDVKVLNLLKIRVPPIIS